MSDTIDAPPVTTAATSTPRLSTETTGDAHARIPARDLVRLAQGFYFIFWGLLTAVLVGSQLLMALGTRTFAEIFLGAGVLATLVGTWRLYQVRTLGEAWTSRTGAALSVAALMTYFCLFFYLWRRLPTNTYLMSNALAFIVTGILYVILFGRAVAAMATAFGRRNLALESQVFSAGNIGLLLLPFICALAYVLIMAAANKTSPLGELLFLLERANLLVVVVLLLPFSLTLSLAWACKDSILRQLAALDRRPTSPADRA